VIVEITVDETGNVSRAVVLRSSPVLDQAAIMTPTANFARERWPLPTICAGPPGACKPRVQLS